MMTDPDRAALSAFLPAFPFRFIRFIHPFMPTSTPTFHRNVPLQFVTHLITRSSSSISQRSKTVCFLPTFRHAGHARPPQLLVTHSPFGLCAAPLSRSSSISIAPNSRQPPKKLAISHIPPTSPHSLQAQHAYKHLRLIIYVSITPGGIYLAPKRRIFVKEERHRSTKKRRS